MEAPQPFRILPHLLQQAAYQVIVEEVFGLQEVTRPSQNNPETNCPNSQNSVRKRTGGRTQGTIGAPRTDETFSYIWRRAASPLERACRSVSPATPASEPSSTNASNLGIFLSPKPNQCGTTVLSPCPQLSPEIKLRRFANEDRKNIGRIGVIGHGCSAVCSHGSSKFTGCARIANRTQTNGNARRTAGRRGELESH